MLELKNLLSPQPATAGPKYFIAGPTKFFNKPNIYELILRHIWKAIKKV